MSRATGRTQAQLFYGQDKGLYIILFNKYKWTSKASDLFSNSGPEGLANN